MARLEQDVTLGGRYRLRRRLASGGMGTVWAAQDTVLDRPVAVKVLSDSLGADQRFVERFRREARAAAGLSHPNIAGVFDYGEDGGTPFIVMELIQGETLAQRLRREGPLDPVEAARIAAEVAGALQAAHEAGVVHRDVKPGNVMVDRAGQVKVMDFGIAAAAWAQPITASGTTLGTASYLSPEQASGDRATPASDLYALGCVLYEMLTGAPPFAGDSPVAVAAAHVHQPPIPVRDRAPHVPPELAAACEEALGKDPAARPPSAAAFAGMLRKGAAPTGGGAPRAGAAAPAATESITPPDGTAVLPSAAAPRPPPARVRRRPSAAWLWVALAAVVAVAAGWALVAALTGGPESPPTQPRQTTAPPAATVPSVIGLRARDAEARLNDAGFDQVVFSLTDGRRGIVVGVDPPEGATLSPEETVTLFVGQTSPQGDQDEGGENGKGKGKDKDKGGGEGHG